MDFGHRQGQRRVLTPLTASGDHQRTDIPGHDARFTRRETNGSDRRERKAADRQAVLKKLLPLLKKTVQRSSSPSSIVP